MDIWHKLWFLRPLIVLVMAGPFLIIPALFSLFRKRRGGENAAETRSDETRPDGSGRFVMPGQDTWSAENDDRSQSPSGGAESTPQRRAA
jgi:hypothetical protein